MSFGFECGKPKEPGVYSRVTTYRDWIHSAMQHYDSYLDNWFLTQIKASFIIYHSNGKFKWPKGHMVVYYGAKVSWTYSWRHNTFHLNCNNSNIRLSISLFRRFFLHSFLSLNENFGFWRKIDFKMDVLVFEVILKTLVYLIGK